MMLEYRFGFNGMEKGNEWKGHGNHYTSKFRQYDPRVGRWFSIDPKAKKFPMQSPYVSMNNNPLYLKDPDGDAVFTAIVVGAAIGATMEYGTQVAMNKAKGDNWEDAAIGNIDWTGVAASAATGAVGGHLAKTGKMATRFGKLAMGGTEMGTTAVDEKIDLTANKGKKIYSNEQAAQGFAVSITVGKGAKKMTKTIMSGFPSSDMAKKASSKLKETIKEGVAKTTSKAAKEVVLSEHNVEIDVSYKDGTAPRDGHFAQEAKKAKQRAISEQLKQDQSPVSGEEAEEAVKSRDNAQLNEGQ